MKTKVMIIEDEVDLCSLLALDLKEKGFDVISANDGLSGLEKVKAEKPDIVILDLILPELSGEEVCKEIRKDDSVCSTPILMLTAKNADVDKVIGKVIGANAYFTKPFDSGELFDQIKKLTSHKK
ncbi:MAG: response regulator [Candidatus Omnitrophica bacterium]|nr:response regulator [Candidatus Omnitrophota bacterium]